MCYRLIVGTKMTGEIGVNENKSSDKRVTL